MLLKQEMPVLSTAWFMEESVIFVLFALFYYVFKKYPLLKFFCLTISSMYSQQITKIEDLMLYCVHYNSFNEVKEGVRYSTAFPFCSIETVDESLMFS